MLKVKTYLLSLFSFVVVMFSQTASATSVIESTQISSWFTDLTDTILAIAPYAIGAVIVLVAVGLVFRMLGWIR